jgi:hypothetical protein
MRAILALALCFALVPACVCADAEKSDSAIDRNPKQRPAMNGPAKLNRDQPRMTKLPENWSPPRLNLADAEPAPSSSP